MKSARKLEGKPIAGCLLCDSGCRWCNPGAEVWPDWFRPRKDAMYQAHRVRRGRHPMGAPLLVGSPDATCGNCALVVQRCGGPYKCRLSETLGGVTDVRIRWPACERWIPNYEGSCRVGR